MTDDSSLDALKTQADALGISYHPSIGEAKLQAKIDEAGPAVEAPVEVEVAEVATPVAKPAAKVAETAGQQRSRLKKEQTALRRIRLTCMNPMKSAWKGELITCGNSVTGSLTKYIPYNEAWHVPQIMLNVLKDRTCQIFPDKKNGVVVAGGKIIPEFAIEELAPLTEKELKDLAQRQAMAAGTAA